MTTNNKPNRLINEKSPYLLQHAYNPVDWYPWGEEAFEKAKRENKPVFVSIGYSTCHWCHVMAHESFEDGEVAQLLNERFVSIKVDREERPDIDSIYMRVCQMLTQHGGWPLSVFLTPDQKPFYAGTYFPKQSRYGKPGFKDVITQLYDQYQKKPEKIVNASERITEALNAKVEVDKNEMLTKEVLHEAYDQLESSFDSEYGGFGQEPKFPMPHNLMYLLRYHLLTKKEDSIYYVTKTLDSMSNGGIFDHIGFGFARYSVDRKWLVPHFEKMLYDNALLITAYTEAYQVTKEEKYKEIVNQIAAFVKREMLHDNGGFYSAIDADSEGVEGKYYVWDQSEILQILGQDLGSLYCEAYDITKNGNFEGKNIPNLIKADFEALTEKYDLSDDELKEQLETARKFLLTEREKRVYPHVDDKILTSWNSLMISALAKSSRAFDSEEYLTLAAQALTFIENHLFAGNRLMVRYRDGEVKNKGYIDDYAALLLAYIEMYQTTYDLKYILKAKNLSSQMFYLFWDQDHGGFYFYGNDSENLISREKEIYDGAMPSGNGMATVGLMKLAGLTGDLNMMDHVIEMFSAFKSDIENYPSSHTFFLQGLLLKESSRKEVVILGKKNDPKRLKLIQALQSKLMPHVSVLVGESPSDFEEIADFATEYKALNDQTTIYICENFACQQPTTDVDAVIEEIERGLF